MKYKITTLVENCSYKRSLRGEHGLSLYIETPKHKILFDTGASDLFIHNAHALNIDLKQVVNTNKCLIHLEKHGDKLLIISCIDNLLKGASGQAVHNMNLMFNLEETVGLRLKPSAF